MTCGHFYAKTLLMGEDRIPMATIVARTHIHRAKTTTQLQAVNWLGGWAFHEGPAAGRILSLYPVMQKRSDHDAQSTRVNVLSKRAKFPAYSPREDVVWPFGETAGATATTPRVLKQAGGTNAPERQAHASTPRGSKCAVVYHNLVRLRLTVSPKTRGLIPQEA